jgi:flagellar hook protein FlgE
MTFNETQAADGESSHTTFIVYDSLGTPLTLDVTMVLEQKTSAGTTWRFYATAADDTDTEFVIGTGLVNFDTDGQFIDSPQNGIVIDRQNSGAVSPLGIDLDFTRMNSLALDPSSGSTIFMSYQDGFSTGTLIDYSVGQDGTITGTFTNGLNQVLGQVALATFANNAGLLARSDNVYFVGPNSGEARISAPLTLGAGKISSGSLELSNVDLSREFINLITSSTAFSASSRVISTSDQLLQELLLIARR